MWERGLKLLRFDVGILANMSLPMWERGLKLLGFRHSAGGLQVAPHVGAWIETGIEAERVVPSYVAPHVGAWIETNTVGIRPVHQYVAPHVGAWIET